MVSAVPVTTLCSCNSRFVKIVGYSQNIVRFFLAIIGFHTSIYAIFKIRCYYKVVMLPKHNKYRSRAIILGFASGILYALWFLGYYLNPSVMTKFDVSALLGRGESYYKLFVAGDVIAGVLILLLIVSLLKTFHKTWVWKRTSFWICLGGLLAFGAMTGIACFFPACLASSNVCTQNLEMIFDWHDITGTIASFGQFLSLVSALVLVHKKVSNNVYMATLLITIVWSMSGIVFISFWTGNLHVSLFLQHLFLVLSSLALVAVPWSLTRPKFTSSL